jgi:hypothetical protein
MYLESGYFSGGISVNSAHYEHTNQITFRCVCVVLLLLRARLMSVLALVMLELILESIVLVSEIALSKKSPACPTPTGVKFSSMSLPSNNTFKRANRYFDQLYPKFQWPIRVPPEWRTDACTKDSSTAVEGPSRFVRSRSRTSACRRILLTRC